MGPAAPGLPIYGQGWFVTAVVKTARPSIAIGTSPTGWLAQMATEPLKSVEELRSWPNTALSVSRNDVWPLGGKFFWIESLTVPLASSNLTVTLVLLLFGLAIAMPSVYATGPVSETGKRNVLVATTDCVPTAPLITVAVAVVGLLEGA